MAERTDEENRPVEETGGDDTAAGMTGDGDIGGLAGDPFERPEDRAAERFLELEAELASGSEATLPDGSVRAGRLVDAALVPTADVPPEYPVDIGQDEALALTVELEGGRTVPTYLDWPEDRAAEESRLGRLLTGMDVAPEQLAELFGRRVLVTVVNGRYTLYLPDEPPRGTGRDVYGVLAGAVGSVAALVGFTLTLNGLLFLLFLFLTLLVLPLATYRDGWYLRTHSDWEGGPVFWATLAMIPGLNLLSTALYLRARTRATYL